MTTCPYCQQEIDHLSRLQKDNDGNQYHYTCVDQILTEWAREHQEKEESMKRITIIKCVDEPTFVPDNEKWFINDEFGVKCLCGEVVNRLSEYEDTGLMPKDVANLESELAIYRKAFEEVCHQFNYGNEKDYENMRDAFLAEAREMVPHDSK